MSRQAEALRLADVLDSVVGGALCNRAAAELRRQHAECERLRIERNALRSLDDSLLTEFNALHAECDALRAALEDIKSLALTFSEANSSVVPILDVMEIASAALKEAK